MAVVGALELDDLVAPGERARQADGGHGGLGARVDKAHHLDRGHPFDHAPRKIQLERARCAVAGPARRGLLHRRHHSRVRVPEDERPPRKDVVDVAVTVDVDEIRALAALDEERLPTDGFERPHGRVDAAGQQALRGGEELDGAVDVLPHNSPRLTRLRLGASRSAAPR